VAVLSDIFATGFVNKYHKHN